MGREEVDMQDRTATVMILHHYTVAGYFGGADRAAGDCAARNRDARDPASRQLAVPLALRAVRPEIGLR